MISNLNYFALAGIIFTVIPMIWSVYLFFARRLAENKFIKLIEDRVAIDRVKKIDTKIANVKFSQLNDILYCRSSVSEPIADYGINQKLKLSGNLNLNYNEAMVIKNQLITYVSLLDNSEKKYIMEALNQSSNIGQIYYLKRLINKLYSKNIILNNKHTNINIKLK